jgi:hypothetical protein
MCVCEQCQSRLDVNYWVNDEVAKGGNHLLPLACSPTQGAKLRLAAHASHMTRLPFIVPALSSHNLSHKHMHTPVQT